MERAEQAQLEQMVGHYFRVVGIWILNNVIGCVKWGVHAAVLVPLALCLFVPDEVIATVKAMQVIGPEQLAELVRTLISAWGGAFFLAVYLWMFVRAGIAGEWSVPFWPRSEDTGTGKKEGE